MVNFKDVYNIYTLPLYTHGMHTYILNKFSINVPLNSFHFHQAQNREKDSCITQTSSDDFSLYQGCVHMQELNFDLAHLNLCKHDEHKRHTLENGEQ